MGGGLGEGKGQVGGKRKGEARPRYEGGSTPFGLPGFPHLHNSLTPRVSGSLEKQTAGPGRHQAVTSLLPADTSVRRG